MDDLAMNSGSLAANRFALNEKGIWYLSHPVAPDSLYTFQQNLDHALKMMKLCFEEGFRVYAPWHTLCLIMPDDVPEYRKLGLEIDCDLAKMTGLMILCGHKVSSGMTQELMAMSEREDAYWIDATELSDANFRALLKRRRSQFNLLKNALG